MELGSTSFLVGLPVVPEGDPESNEEDTDNNDCGNTPPKEAQLNWSHAAPVD